MGVRDPEMSEFLSPKRVEQQRAEHAAHALTCYTSNKLRNEKTTILLELCTLETLRIQSERKECTVFCRSRKHGAVRCVKTYRSLTCCRRLRRLVLAPHKERNFKVYPLGFSVSTDSQLA